MNEFQEVWDDKDIYIDYIEIERLVMTNTRVPPLKQRSENTSFNSESNLQMLL